MSTGIIYCAHCIVNGKKYIGQTKQKFKERIRGHKKDSNKFNVKFYRAINKYGWNNFIWGIIEECPLEELNELEFFYIQKYNTYYDGYNSTFGGHNRTDPSNRENLVNASSREFSLKSPDGIIINGKNVKKFAKDNNLCLRSLYYVLNGRKKFYKGWTLPEVSLKEHQIIDPNGNLYTFRVISEFAKHHGLSYSVLSSVLNGKAKYCRGWHLPKIPSQSYKFSKEFCLKSPEGKIINGKNTSKFCKENNLSSSAIYAVISGKRKSYKGWTKP